MGSTISEQTRQFYSEHVRDNLRNWLFSNRCLSVTNRKDLLTTSSSVVRDLWYYGEQEEVELFPPTHIGELPYEIERKVGTWKIDAPFVARCNDVQLVGPDALPISSNDAYILEGADGSTSRATDALVQSLLGGVIPRYRPASAEYDVAVSLAGPWSDQFFHWFVEYLPRLIAVEAYAGKLDIDPVYLVPTDRPNWMSRSLELLHIPDNRIFSWKGGRVQVQQLLVPSLWRDTESTAPEEGYVHSPRGISEVATRMRNNVSDAERRDRVGTRIYISRSGESTRQVVNEDELRSTLDAYGFDIVRPQTWSLDEQVATFSNAEVIAGPHGGGLTNAMYSSKPTVMEIFGRRINPCYYALFAGSGWDYGLLNADAVGNDIRVDPNNFRQLCQKLLD